jgi:hypothetical protein
VLKRSLCPPAGDQGQKALDWDHVGQVTFGPGVGVAFCGVLKEVGEVECKGAGVVVASSPDISQIVVSVDGSRFAERAVAPGRLLAERLHASLTVVTPDRPRQPRACPGSPIVRGGVVP